jgi:hypothetical protein
MTRNRYEPNSSCCLPLLLLLRLLLLPPLHLLPPVCCPFLQHQAVVWPGAADGVTAQSELTILCQGFGSSRFMTWPNSTQMALPSARGGGGWRVMMGGGAKS